MILFLNENFGFYTLDIEVGVCLFANLNTQFMLTNYLNMSKQNNYSKSWKKITVNL